MDITSDKIILQRPMQFMDSGVNMSCEGQVYFGSAISTRDSILKERFKSGLLRCSRLQSHTLPF